MGTLLATVGLAVAVVLAATGCEAPDSSGLFGPAEPASIRMETPSIEPSPDAVSADIGLGSDASAVASGGGPLPPGAGAAGDGGVSPPLEPPLPGAPSADAGSVIEPVTPDAGNEPPPPPPAASECAGSLLEGICWYLGELGQACDAVCATHGGFDPASAAWIGTPSQGGSIESCGAVLETLGESSVDLTEGFRDDALGFGCHLFLDASGTSFAWWLTAPEFSATVSDPSARLACGCAG